MPNLDTSGSRGGERPMVKELRMRAAPIISLVLSTALGLGAIIVGRSWLTGGADAAVTEATAIVAPNTAIAAPQTMELAVSTRLIQTGDVVDPSTFDMVPWPKDLVPDGAVTSLSEFADSEEATLYAQGIIAPGEPILQAKLSELPNLKSLSEAIIPGYRAVSIAVSDVTGVAGFVLPEDRVDVSVVREFADEESATVNYTVDRILSYVRVLAVDQAFDQNLEGARPSRTVTLEVSQRDADQLARSAREGELTLSLRSEKPYVPPVRKTAVRVKKAAPPAKPTFADIRVIEGDIAEIVRAPVAPARQREAN